MTLEPCPVCRWPVEVLDLFIPPHAPELGAAPVGDDEPRCPGSGQTPGQLVAFDAEDDGSRLPGAQP